MEEVNSNPTSPHTSDNEAADLEATQQQYTSMGINVDSSQTKKHSHLNGHYPRKYFDKINLTALDGLRGLLAFHILIFHVFVDADDVVKIDLLGNIDMPFFFLLSGFVLAISEASKFGTSGVQSITLNSCCACCSITPDSDKSSSPPQSVRSQSPSSNLSNPNNDIMIDSGSGSSKKFNDNDSGNGAHVFDSKHFYQRRMARILPLYYFTNYVMYLPLIYTGYGTETTDNAEFIYISLLLTLFCAAMWFGIPFVINGSSWFVSSISLFYWLFPRFLTKYWNKHLTRNDKIKIMTKNLILFLFFGIVLTVVVFLLTDSYVDGAIVGFIGCTYWAVPVLALSTSGMLVGLVRFEEEMSQPINNSNNTNNKNSGNTPDSTKKNIKHTTSNTFLQSVHAVFSWDLKYFDTQQKISRQCYMNSGLLAFITTVSVVAQHFKRELFLEFWLQLVLPYLVVKSLYVLSKFSKNEESKKNVIYKVLTGRWMQYLGRISYSLYLTHSAVIAWVTFAFNGATILAIPDCEEPDGTGFDGIIDGTDDCSVDWREYNESKVIPWYAVPVDIILCLVVAGIVSRYFEEPLRQCFRPANKK